MITFIYEEQLQKLTLILLDFFKTVSGQMLGHSTSRMSSIYDFYIFHWLGSNEQLSVDMRSLIRYKHGEQ